MSRGHGEGDGDGMLLVLTLDQDRRGERAKNDSVYTCTRDTLSLSCVNTSALLDFTVFKVPYLILIFKIFPRFGLDPFYSSEKANLASLFFPKFVLRRMKDNIVLAASSKNTS